MWIGRGQFGEYGPWTLTRRRKTHSGAVWQPASPRAVHACDLAKRLKMRRVLCPPDSGVASALGFLVAPPTVDLALSQVIRLSEFQSEAALEILARLETEAASLLQSVGVRGEDITIDSAAEMRYIGQGFEIPVAVTRDILRAGARPLKARFDTEYERVFARAVGDVPAELLTWRVRARGPSPDSVWTNQNQGASDAAAAFKGKRPAFFHDPSRAVETSVFDRYRLGPGAVLTGQAFVEERESTAIVPPGARATIDEQCNLLIELEG